MKALNLCTVITALLISQASLAQTDEERIQALEEQVEALTEAYEAESGSGSGSGHGSGSEYVNIGGYGELLYHNLDVDGTDDIVLNFRRFVLFFGHDFNDKTRFVSEIEIENTVVSATNRGAVELEQAYVEFDLTPTTALVTGIVLMPVGIINESHEPATFYGSERPVIERTIIPTTWWAAGILLNQRFEVGISYDLFLSEGMKTDDPTVSPVNDPFDLKAGKQKSSFADAHDFAITGRVRYVGTPGLELAAYGQYQPDLDQSAIESYAESATLLGGHAIYQFSKFTATALFARWTLDGEDASAAGRDIQEGGYLELSYRLIPQLGFFARQSAWTQVAGIDNTQTDAGLNFWPYENIVFKFDIQLQNDGAGNADGFNMAMGYQF